MPDSPRQTLIINKCTVKLADDEAGLVAATSFGCVATGVTFTPSANMTEVPATGCAPKSQTAAASSWVMDIAFLQDWSSPGGGLAGYAFTHDADLKWFEVTPTDPALPAVKGQVTVLAGAIYGAFGSLLVATASWPMPDKPDLILPAAAALEGEAEAEADEGAELEPEPA